MSVQAQQGKQFRHVTDFCMVTDARVSRQTPAVNPDNGDPRVSRTDKVGTRFVTNVGKFRCSHVRTAAGLFKHARMGFGLAYGGR